MTSAPLPRSEGLVGHGHRVGHVDVEQVEVVAVVHDRVGQGVAGLEVLTERVVVLDGALLGLGHGGAGGEDLGLGLGDGGLGPGGVGGGACGCPLQGSLAGLLGLLGELGVEVGIRAAAVDVAFLAAGEHAGQEILHLLELLDVGVEGTHLAGDLVHGTEGGDQHADRRAHGDLGVAGCPSDLEGSVDGVAGHVDRAVAGLTDDLG
jgi:hypothetical protein